MISIPESVKASLEQEEFIQSRVIHLPQGTRMVIHQQHQVAEENMSNLTSASGEAASISSIQQQCSYANSVNPTNPVLIKKRRNLPGNPDPDAEVVALSPKTLMATNRFVCEICNKGFQRDQNLQLHRRGHNLPWKLKQRTNKEALRKKVFVCPEATCVHHDPSRALGDLTGIKKHFSRKHGEKKWKCERCSKKYAVQSDWKAHSKICGTREYRCDCGTLFSRRDSFITHRAFCDALAEESARAITANPLVNHQQQLLFSQSMSSQDQGFPFQQTSMLHRQFPHCLMRTAEAPGGGHGLPQEFSLKREQQQQEKQFGDMGSDVPQWLACQGSASHLELPSSIYSSRTLEQVCSHVENIADQSSLPLLHSYQAAASSSSSSSPHMSATAMLQKAAQMGATMSRQPNMVQMAVHTANAASFAGASSSGFGLGLTAVNQGMTGGSFAPPPLLQDVALRSLASAPGFDGPFVDAFGGMLGSKSEGVNGMDAFLRNNGRGQDGDGGGGGGRGGRDEMTRDFLGLRAFPQQGGILSLTGLEPCMAPHSYDQTQQSKRPWQG